MNLNLSVYAIIFLLVVVEFLVLAILVPRQSENVFRSIERAFAKLAKRGSLGTWLLFFWVVLVRLALLPLLPIPIPGVHDEFSYLLMADTFVRGRLANPPHPMWISFETFHVNWLPTYSSMYPPAQGFALALGQWLGHPWIGVLLSASAMCAAIHWMLRAWLPARWAFLGGVLAALKFGINSYWINSYWGGAMAAIGGALVLGALPRIAKRPATRDALILGLGVAILANSRPYEGFLFCIPAAVWFLWWFAGKVKSRARIRDRLTLVVVPLSAILFLAVAFMAYYNWRLTANPLLFPHTLNTRTYESAALFLWQHPREQLHYHNEQFEDFYNNWEPNYYNNSWRDVWKVTAQKFTLCGSTYFWWGALLLLPGLPCVFWDRKLRLPMAAFLFVVAGFLAVIWSGPHYVAPVTCVVILILVQAIRHLRTVTLRGRPVGAALARAAILLLVVDCATAAAQRSCDPVYWTCTGDPSRVAVIEKLSRLPGKHLVVVRYQEEDHNLHDDWVFNGAEIDSAKILWARDTNPEQNASLFAYFKDRQIWLIEPDQDNTKLMPYPLSPSSQDDQ
jgi:hypothetical protein